MIRSLSTLILILLLLLQLFPVKSQKPLPLVPALYVFGDSLSDAGNNNKRETYAKANYPPYGVDFIHGATGRFTNGKTFVDFTAEMLGLPLIPAYLSLSVEERSKTAMGLNYASGSAGILDETGKRLGKCVNLKEQLDYFEKTVQRDLPQMLQGSQLSEHLSESILLVSIGSNDYINNYLQPDYYASSHIFNPDSFAQLLIDTLQKHIERLYELGARKVVLFDIGAIGCIPNITNSEMTNGKCVEEINNFVVEFNNRLPSLIKHLSSTLHGSNFVQGQTYRLSLDIYNNPSKYGFSHTNVPCCITYGVGIGPCMPHKEPCADRNKHMYFDAYHPTEAQNSLMAKRCFKESPSICSPMNIQQFAHVSDTVI